MLLHELAQGKNHDETQKMANRWQQQIADRWQQQTAGNNKNSR